MRLRKELCFPCAVFLFFNYRSSSVVTSLECVSFVLGIVFNLLDNIQKRKMKLLHERSIFLLL